MGGFVGTHTVALQGSMAILALTPGAEAPPISSSVPVRPLRAPCQGS